MIRYNHGHEYYYQPLLKFQQKAEPLGCLALRTRGDRFNSYFAPWELSQTHLKGSWFESSLLDVAYIQY